MKAHALILLSLLAAACDKDKPADPTPTTSATAPVATAAPSAAPSATAPASATAAASDTAPVDLANVMITIKDAATEPQKSVKAKLGGTVTLFLPDAAGSSWAVDVADKALGKPKEEIMPGFGPGTNAHQFQFSTKGAALKVGETHKCTFVAKKGGKPNGTFALSIEIVG
jgi:hypothetical protein